MTDDRRGKWDSELFARYRASAGPRRRMMLGQLLYENEPLIKLLVDQLCGRGSKPRRGARTFMGGCQGFREIPWEDAMQGGRMAFVKACEQFDPSKGKISWYLKNKIRHELQMIVTRELRLVRVSRGRESEIVPVALVGEQAELDVMGGACDAGLVESDDITPEDVERWSASGEWPEDLDEARAQVEARRALGAEPPPATARPAIETFLVLRAELRPSARTLVWEAHNAYRLECRIAGEDELSRPEFVRELALRANLREVRIRTAENPAARALAGLRLVAS